MPIILLPCWEILMLRIKKASVENEIIMLWCITVGRLLMGRGRNIGESDFSLSSVLVLKVPAQGI